MEKIIEDLKNVFLFKDTTDIGDIVLVVTEQLFYALVTDIARDESKKDEWWHVTLEALIMPPQQMVWTLRTAQLTGMEIFTMGGVQRFVKAIDFGGSISQKKKSNEIIRKGKKRTALRLVK